MNHRKLSWLYGVTALSVLLAAAPALSAQPAPVPALEAAAATVLWGEASPRAEPRNDIQRVALGGGAFVERLKGDAALAHLYNAMSRRPDAFAAARRSLARRGFTSTPLVYVERTIRLARNPAGEDRSTTLPAQTHSEQNGDGEIIFWSWDDGQNATWEGAIYVEIYSTGSATTWEGQIDASTTEHPWIYYEKTWQGGGGGPHEVRFGVPPPLPGMQAVPAVSLGQASSYGAGYAPASWLGWAVCWRRCVVVGCGTAAIGCLSSGPAWPGCFAAWCLGAEIMCAVGCAM